MLERFQGAELCVPQCLSMWEEGEGGHGVSY